MEEKKKSKNELLQEKMFIDRKSSWLVYNEKQKKEIHSFCEDYKKFMSENKTERICVENIIRILKSWKFKDIKTVKKAKSGDRLYKIFKNKSVIAFVVGKNKERFNIVASHIDSPRLDLKPSPLYEDSELGMLKSHYYGGIKKYHWVNTPLILEGVVITKNGKKHKISIGRKDDEAVFIIPDLEPHLARDQMEKKGVKVVEGEELNIIIGNIPVEDEEIKEKIKFNILKTLYEKYGIIEEDFNCAELEFVPAYEPKDVGLDASMIGAYGQDDKVCVYTSLRALLNVNTPNKTAVCFFVDKEEIGSFGDTGAQSMILHNFGFEYKKLVGTKEDVSAILECSKAISADVTVAMNPNYKEVNDTLNVSYLGKGVSVEKYGGGGGKYSTNDAHAEYMSYMRKLLDENKIPWQTGELGKIDVGGGGTVAMYLSRYGMDCVDAGPCLLSMHSPFEVASKADIYSAYGLYKAFLKD